MLQNHFLKRVIQGIVKAGIGAKKVSIMNARPLLPISSDPDTLEVISPAMLLNQKASTVPAPLGDFHMKDLYKKE